MPKRWRRCLKHVWRPRQFGGLCIQEFVGFVFGKRLEVLSGLPVGDLLATSYLALAAKNTLLLVSRHLTCVTILGMLMEKSL